MGQEGVSGNNPLSSVLILGGTILLIFAFSSLLLLAFDIGQGIGSPGGLLGIALFLLFLTSGGAVILTALAQKNSVRNDREKLAFQSYEIGRLKARLAELEKARP